MEISVLQSLIDRTSIEIESNEAFINFLRNAGDYDDSIRKRKRTIAKLVKIQKALKKEIASKIRLERGINHIRKMKEILQEGV